MRHCIAMLQNSGIGAIFVSIAEIKSDHMELFENIETQFAPLVWHFRLNGL